MGLLDSFGTSLLVGGQTSLHGATVAFSSYIVASTTDGGVNVDFEDVDEADGARGARLIFKRDKVYRLELICRSDAVPLTDFPVGSICAISGLSTCYVESCDIAKTRSATKVTATVVNIGVT